MMADLVTSVSKKAKGIFRPTQDMAYYKKEDRRNEEELKGRAHCEH